MILAVLLWQTSLVNPNMSVSSFWALHKDNTAKLVPRVIYICVVCKLTCSHHWSIVFSMKLHNVTIMYCVLWRVGCLPLIISNSPSLNRRPSPGSRREWVCERGGALKTARSGGVWWGTPEVNGASSPPLLYAECASPRETGLFPVHACWCPRGSRKGAWRDRVPYPWDGWQARMPGRLIPGSAAGRRKTKLPEKPPPLAPRTSEGSKCGRRTPPLTWTLPSRTHCPSFTTPQHDEDTRSPVYFGHFIPFGHFILYFCWIKASPRPDATPTVSVVCSSRHKYLFQNICLEAVLITRIVLKINIIFIQLIFSIFIIDLNLRLTVCH